MLYFYRLMLFALLSVSTVAHAISLTPEQMKMIGGLSPQEKASLAGQAGISLPGTTLPKAMASPETVQVRAVGKGPVEAVVEQAADGAALERVVSGSKLADVPVKSIGSQAGGDRLELRRAFSNFVRESKPLQVDVSQLKQFGYELFAGVPTTFAPATDVPVPASYVLGPGDEMQVQLFGLTSETFTLVVDREGSVAFPVIGPIVLAGMSFSEAKLMLKQQIRKKMVGISTNIVMGKLRSIRIFSLGEVERPGSYVVSGLATLSHALFVSGGVKKTGSLRHIQLKRQGKVVAAIDLYDFLLQGDTSQDMRLLPGDVVFVPPIGKTAVIAGEVVRPAIYEIKGVVDVAAMVQLAGGYLPKAYRNEALLERIHASGHRSVKSFALSGKGLKIEIHNGDVIKVFPVTDFEENPVLLVGNVKRPGKYGWHKGMRISDLIANEQALLPETFMDYAVIEREALGNREPEIVRFKLSDVFLKKGGSGDLVLRARDKLFVFHRSHFRIAPKVSIAGDVKEPGSYEHKKNMRLLDLVLAGGGLTRDSYLKEAELYRTDPVTNDVHVSRFSLAEVMSGKNMSNILLQDLDRVVVHSVWEKKYKHVVTIQGEVKSPGEFQLGLDMRLSDLLFAADGVTRNVLMGDVQVYRSDEKTKEISLLVVNLEQALAGNMDQNIVLHDLDRVVIHSIWEKKQRYKVQVIGEVHKPGGYVFAESGMRIADLIFAAGGVTEKSFISKAEITRYKVVDGEARESMHLEVDLGRALAGDVSANISLQPYDVLTVRQLSNWRVSEQVAISGEVKYPGSYPVEDGEHLSSLLERAGGFSKKAYLEAAVFTRVSIRLRQQEQMQQMVEQVESELAQLEVSFATISDPGMYKSKQKALESAKRVLISMKAVKASGRLVIKLSDIEVLKKTDFDLTLRSGDKLHVPKRPDQVMVMGQVYNSTALLYQRSMSVDDYIEAAGGTTRMSDMARMYIVRASGMVDSRSQWWLGAVQPGDTIVVPEELERFYLLDSLLDWSKVLMNVGIAGAAMTTIGVF